MTPPRDDGGVRVNRTLVIPPDELELRFTTSGGPGGQHANRAATRVEVVFDVAASVVLGPRQRARLLERVGPVVRAVASESRSQSQNRDVALQRLGDKIAAALAVARPRVATKVSESARRRRVDDKRRRARVKEWRRAPDEDA